MKKGFESDFIWKYSSYFLGFLYFVGDLFIFFLCLYYLLWFFVLQPATEPLETQIKLFYSFNEMEHVDKEIETGEQRESRKIPIVTNSKSIRYTKKLSFFYGEIELILYI